MSPTAVETAPARTREKFQGHDIAASDLWPSPLNPRKTIDPTALKELAASIRENGIIEPLVVRQKPQFDNGTGPQFEIAAGERRWRASLLVHESPLPCVVRELTDAQLVELALNENQQRDSIHPLEEAAAIQLLLDLDPTNTIASIARKMGEEYAWVYNRLKLLRMSELAQSAYRAIGADFDDHAAILAKVPSHQQDGALAACFSDLLYEIPELEEEGGKVDPPYTVAEAVTESRWDLLKDCLNSTASLRRWIASHTTIDIADQAVQEELPTLAEAQADAAAEEKALVQVSLDPQLTETQAKELGVIRRARWIEIDETATPEPGRVSNERCEHMRRAAVTHPATPKTLRVPVVTICSKRSCPVHRPAPPKRAAGSSKVTDRERKAEEKRQVEEAERVERARVWKDEQRPKYLAALVTQVAKVKTLSTTLVRSLLDQQTLDDLTEFYGVELTPKTALTVLILANAPLSEWTLGRESRHLQEFGDIFGLTPAQWEKTQKAAKPTKAVKKTATAKATAKPKKGGR